MPVLTLPIVILNLILFTMVIPEVRKWDALPDRRKFLNSLFIFGYTLGMIAFIFDVVNTYLK